MKSINERLAEHANKLADDADELDRLDRLGIFGDEGIEAFSSFLRNEARILNAILNGEQYKNYPEFD